MILLNTGAFVNLAFLCFFLFLALFCLLFPKTAGMLLPAAAKLDPSRRKYFAWKRLGRHTALLLAGSALIFLAALLLCLSVPNWQAVWCAAALLLVLLVFLKAGYMDSGPLLIGYMIVPKETKKADPSA